MENTNLHRALYTNFIAAGITAISVGTAAKILAVIYVHGNHEALTHNVKLKADIEYIQARYGISGGEKPDREFGRLFRKYVKLLELYYDPSMGYNYTLEKENLPDWATDLFSKRYGITFKEHKY